MPASGAARRRRLAALRGAGFAVAIALGGIAVWLIVTSTSQKRIEIGILTGLWGLLLGSYSVFGSRSPNRAAVAPPSGPAGQALDVRHIDEIERTAVAAARREFRIELEEMLRREVQAGLAQEVAGLRNEVAALRNELVEKVGGQLRLERIETTRLIGSDLEALQHELRQLRHVGGGESDGDHDDGPMVSITKAVGALPATGSSARTPATVRTVPATRRHDIEDAEIVVEQVPPAVPSRPRVPPAPRVPYAAPAPEPVATEPVAAEPVVVDPITPEPIAVEPAPESEPAPEPEREPRPVFESERAPVFESEPAPEPAPEREPAPEPAPEREPAPALEKEPAPEREPAASPPSATPPQSQSVDPFASLPRITPFTEFALDPITPEPAAPKTKGAAAAGRHSTGTGDAGSSGRRHRADDSADDVLARILAREHP